MTISYRTLRTALASVATASALASVSGGCGSTDCTETATCEPADNGDEAGLDSNPSEATVDVANDQGIADGAQDSLLGDAIVDNTVAEAAVEETSIDQTNENAMAPEGGSEMDVFVPTDGDATVAVDVDAGVDGDATLLGDTTVDADAADSMGQPDVKGDSGDADATVVDALPDVQEAGDAAPEAGDAMPNSAETGVQCSATAGDQCYPVAPSGAWHGPALFWTNPYSSPVPGCQNGYVKAIEAFAGPTAPPDVCPCSCSPSGQTCSATLQAYYTLSCTGPCAATTTISPGCSPINPVNCGSQGSFDASVPEPSGGTCTPQVTIVDGGAPTWASAALFVPWRPPSDRWLPKQSAVHAHAAKPVFFDVHLPRSTRRRMSRNRVLSRLYWLLRESP